MLKHLDLLKAYANDLRDVQDTFSSQKTTSNKEQMSDASQTPNPLDACLKDGRDESFANCLAALELCNRSLSDYLETKRKKFPRFYFISAADLVDILSKVRDGHLPRLPSPADCLL